MSKENPYEKELPTVVDPSKDSDWFSEDKKDTVPGTSEGTDLHEGIAQYMGILRNEWSDKKNSAYVVARDHVDKAAKSLLESVKAHMAGDHQAAATHMESTVKRLHLADSIANGGSNAVLQGIPGIDAAFEGYKQRHGIR